MYKRWEQELQEVSPKAGKKHKRHKKKPDRPPGGIEPAPGGSTGVTLHQTLLCAHSLAPASGEERVIKVRIIFSAGPQDPDGG